MKIIIQTNKVKCDVGNCMNTAEFSLTPDGVSADRYINVCGSCMVELYGAMAPLVTKRRRQTKRRECNDKA
ncbi:MAG: hypothetical protein HFE31_05960 [Clostridia bacterium]|nr:hypothetical protein [Clostridia bacterium]MDE6884911.1 hypothetical protein [Clostridia bacterium]